MQNISPVLRTSLRIALVAAACLSLHPLRAQIQQQLNGPINAADAPEPVYTTTRLDAVVVSSLDGKPVPRVLVTSPDHRMAAITDSEGRFSFELRRIASQTSRQEFSSYPPSPTPLATTIPVQLNVQKPGYVTNTVTLHLSATQPDTPEPALQLKIVPAAILTGHLDPEAGDLPANTTVQLRQKQIQNGLATWIITRGAQVSSRGEFRFANLQPGDYKLLAPAYDPEYILKQPLPESIPGFRASFYPNADSLDSAAVIHLGPGESSSANLIEHNATFYNVSIPVTGVAGDKGFYAALLPDVPGLSISHNSLTHAAQAYLPSGSYNVLLIYSKDSTPKGENPNSSIASVHLQIDNKPVRTQPVAFHPAFEIPVEVRSEFTNVTPPQYDPQHSNPLVWVSLQSAVPVSLNPSTENVPGGAVVKDLSEGLFHVDVAPATGGYVAAVTSGDTDLLREPLLVLPGVAPRPIEVTLRDDSASISGSILLNGTPPPSSSDNGIWVSCFALDRPQAPFPGVQLAQQLQFTLANLAPGRYLVLASHQLQQNIEYRNPDVMRDLLGKGTVITLSPNQKAEIQVPLMPDEEAK